ncbi:SLACS reverse transcriptase [Angomonas deanei]|nr:SLACS reverse transcriptase [Angomonas deanei]|eukprot:EPY33012.1 SLACS reverse transcriptase [Angomonas deanei]
MAEFGFTVNTDKTQVLGKTPVTVMGSKIAPSRETIRILGAGFHPDGASTEPYVTKHVRKQDLFFNRLLTQGYIPKTAGMMLLRACAVPRMNFLLRTHPKEDTEKAANWFDQRIASTLQHLVGHQLDERAMAIAQLPIRGGGLGIRSQEVLSKYAYDCVGKKGKQKEATTAYEKELSANLYATLDQNEKHILVSNCHPGANRLLVDGEATVGLSDEAFETMLKQRLLLPVISDPSLMCRCGATATNQHLNTCTQMENGPRTVRHDRVKYAIASWAQQLGFRVEVESKADPHTKQRLDLVIHTAGGVYATDVSVTYPAKVSENNKFGQALQVRFSHKMSSYATWAMKTGGSYTPFILESTGKIHQESMRWIREVACKQTTAPFSSQTSVEVLMARLAAELQEGNHLQFGPLQLRQVDGTGVQIL